MKGMVSVQKRKVHHVGIIMPTLERAGEFIELFGLEEEYRGYVDSYQAWCIFLEPNGGSKIELIVPTGGKLAEYNGGKGGLHHIAFDVADVEAARLEFAEQGIRLLEDKAVPGAGNIIVNFMRPRDGKGILTEYVETV
jgi:lactoylglutathione lyase/methylmalonyl-CoA/ethylmalonyl-CoA epimerase